MLHIIIQLELVYLCITAFGYSEAQLIQYLSICREDDFEKLCANVGFYCSRLNRAVSNSECIQESTCNMQFNLSDKISLGLTVSY